MTDPVLKPGKSSSEFILSIAVVGAFTALVALDKITLTTSMMETVFQALMVYVGARALPKTAQQLRDIGGAKTLQKLNVQLLDALEREQTKT